MELGAIPKTKSSKDQNQLKVDETVETIQSLPDEILEHIFALISITESRQHLLLAPHDISLTRRPSDNKAN